MLYIKTQLRESVYSWKAVSPRIITARIHLERQQFVSVVSVYAPTLTSPDEAQIAFYEDLDHTLREIPMADFLILMGDFNARVGRESEIWQGSIGRHGIGKMNENGRLPC